MGKFWLIAKLFKMMKDNPTVLSDFRDMFKGRSRAYDERAKDLRDLEMSVTRLERRVEALEKTMKKVVTAAFVIAAVAVAALVLAIIKLA